MKGTSLKFYVHEHRRHHGILLYEWLLEQAKKMGIHGGTALRAIAGFGRHGIMHEEHFFELTGNVPIAVEFVVNDDEAERLLELIKLEKIQVFYMKMPVEYGLLEGK
jgi:PII-like signaling protein